MTSPVIAVSDITCRDHGDEHACRYRVAWSINPHMTIGAVDFRRATVEHECFVAALRRAGAEITRFPFVHAAYDSVFIKDAALLLERDGSVKALLAQPRHAERRLERHARSEAYARAGYDVVCDDSAPIWEGGDIVMLPSDAGLLLGVGPRSNGEAAAWLERHTGLPVTSLELHDPHLYHLDMAVSVLPDGCALVCASALTPASMLRLERTKGITHIVLVPREDALRFGLNIVTIGRTVVCGAAVTRTAELIRQRGYRVLVSPLDQFHLAGGSAACLVATVHPPGRPVEPVAHTPGGQTVDIYGSLFRSVVKPIWENHVRRRPVLERWHLLKRSQYASLDELHELQARKLKMLVTHAYEHVPFYRQRFEALDLIPGDIVEPQDLLKLPVLRRAELQGRTDRASTNGRKAAIARQTSGTTGEPLLFGFEADSEHWRHATRLRAYEWAGFRPGDTALYFWGARLPTKPSLRSRMKIALDRRLHRERYVPCDVMSEEHLQDTVRLFRDMKPRVLVCYAQAGAELARFINRNSLRTWAATPVICGAERLLPRDRADLEAAFGSNVFDTYGCREVMLIGSECEAHRGLHLSMENLVVEIVVNDENGMRHAQEGETGEVVITDLHNLAMPFIRYANGDIATAGSTARCTCGRTLPRIASAQGRLSEMLHDGTGATISGLAISFLFHDVAGCIRQFQAVQHTDHSVSINIVLAGSLPPSKLDELRASSARLLRGVPVKVQVVPHLPRSPAGKHRIVVVET